MNDIDKMFKNKLEHFTVDIPPGAWENIESRLPEKRSSKRPFLHYFLTAISIFIALGSIYIIKEIKEHRNQQDSNTVIACSDIMPSSGVLNAKAETFNSTINQDITSINENTNGTSAINETALNKAITLQNTRLSTSSEAKSVTQQLNATLQTGIESVVEMENFGNNEVSKSDLITDVVVAISERAQNTVESVTIAPINNIENTGLRSNLYSAVKMQFDFGKEKPAKACPFAINVNDKSIDAYFSHDYASRKLGLNDASSQSYVDMRNTTEHSMYSFSAGVRFGYNIGYRWNLHSGVNYSQINEKFSYIDPESNQTRLITIKDYIYLNGKIVDSIVTEEVVTIPGTSVLKVYNKYKSFDIPVLARFTILANERLSISALGGVYVNLAFTQKGMFLDRDGSTPIEFTSSDKKESTIFRTQMGVSLYSSLSLAYHLTPEIDFLLEPNARFQTESMTLGTYPVSQRYNTFGISTGVRYKF